MNTFLSVICNEISDLCSLKLHYEANDEYSAVINEIYNCKGKVIVSGVGKSGHIGKKIAATFASVGTPSFFVHPSEACHGDLGMIEPNDVIIAISHSGETSELLLFLPFCKNNGNKIIAITSNNNSSLGRLADVCLCTFIKNEADVLNLAPTSSTTATLVLGDALAIAVASYKHFSKEDFAKTHPSGTLGKKLLLTNKSIMRTGNDVPIVRVGMSLSESIIIMTEKRLGFVVVVSQDSNKLQGIFTDGDLRRIFKDNVDINNRIEDLMNPNCISVKDSDKAFKSLELIKHLGITNLVVTDDSNNVIGAFCAKDLLAFGF